MYILSEFKRFSYETSGNREPATADIIYDTSATKKENVKATDFPVEEKETTSPRQKPIETQNVEEFDSAFETIKQSIKTNKQKEEKSRKMADKKTKKTGKKKGTAIKVIALIIALGIIASSLFVFGIIPLSGGTGNTTYSVDSAEKLVKYLKHPALQSGDTIKIETSMTVDINSDFGGFATLPLVNYDCGGNTLTFSGGSAALLGASKTANMNGVSFSDCTVYVEAPATALTWSECADDSHINARYLNGTAHKQDSGIILAGSKLKVPVTLTNVGSETANGVTVNMTSSNLVITGDKSFKVNSLGAGESMTIEVPVIAAYGGRARITGYGVSGGTLLVKAESAYVDVAGEGYYAGDLDTHTSDAATREDNITYGYKNGMSFIASNTTNVKESPLSSQEIEALTGTKTGFVQLNSYYGGGQSHQLCSVCLEKKVEPDGIPGRYVLALGTDIIPNTVFMTIQYHPQWTYQQAVDEVLEGGGVSVLPFFYGNEYDISESISMSKTLYGISGMEVMTSNYPYIPDGMETKVAFNVWKLFSTFGNEKVFATASSGSVVPDDVGTSFIKGKMNGLSENAVYNMIKSGDFFFSNGPELSFKLGGANMGEDFTTIEGASTIANMYATDDHAITSVKLTKYFVTHDKNDIPSEVVYEEDLSGQGVYTFSKNIELTVNPNEYYIFDVTTESSTKGTGAGYASSNPIYAIASENADAKVAGTAISDVSYSFGGKVTQADNGTYVLSTSNFISALLNVKSKGNDVTVNYHSLKNSGLCDYLIVTVKASDGTTSTEKIFID